MRVWTPTCDCWTIDVMNASTVGSMGSRGEEGALEGGVDGGVGGRYVGWTGDLCCSHLMTEEALEAK